MGAGPDHLAPDAGGTARANGEAALVLLEALQRRGLEHLVLCPGSRSAPLAVAAALLEARGLRVHTAIDERSAAFFALGLGRALGRPAAVVTTSGTAVAQLLPAAVEADLGTIPLLLISADRPEELKNCGANQAVPQERFLLASSRRLLEGPPRGLAGADPAWLDQLAAEAMTAADGDGHGAPAGPVHLNLPFAEPLHATGPDLEALAGKLEALAREQKRPGTVEAGMLPAHPSAAVTAERDPRDPVPAIELTPALPPSSDGRSGALLADPLSVPGPVDGLPARPAAIASTDPAACPINGGVRVPRLDPDRPGVVVAGPWRGRPQEWVAHCQALRRWQRRTGWPVLADVLSGLRGLPDLEVVAAYDPLLERPDALPQGCQVLRLGSLPASRRLQRWLQACTGAQVLVSQGDPRRLDPLGTVGAGGQWSGGLAAWVEAQLPDAAVPSPMADGLAARPAVAVRWQQLEGIAQETLDRELSDAVPVDRDPGGDDRADGASGDPREGDAADQDAGEGGLSEPWLARALSRLLPPEVPLMLASSSPVRDWESFADPRTPWRPVHGFRGASGIDGTLSLACGLAEACGQVVLVSGDLALLHDANGWLWSRQLRGRLTVVLIENGGGGIFEQLPIRTAPPARLDFERLFAMPQALDQLALAGLHGVPGRRLHWAGELPAALAWALEQPFALLEVRTRRQADARRRLRLRQAVTAAVEARAWSAGRMGPWDPDLP